MKTYRRFIFVTFIITSCLFFGCKKDKEIIPPSVSEYSTAKWKAVANLRQRFHFNAEQGATFTTTNGTVITITANSLFNQGIMVTGQVELEVVELYNRGNMLTLNMPTVGFNSNDVMLPLVSGGEFYVNVRQDGVDLGTTGFSVVVPGNLTGNIHDQMELFDGIFHGDTAVGPEWALMNDSINAMNANANQYHVFSNNFGWTNIDRFYYDSRPKTLIKAQAPVGYDFSNCAIYITYDGEPHLLANFDTYLNNGLFSEHYGEIPIGLTGNIIFVSVDEDDWVYAIHHVTVQNNHVETFTAAELKTCSESELINKINNLP